MALRFDVLRGRYRRSVFVLVFGLCALPLQVLASGWDNTGAMSATRSGHTATLLPDGRVLIVGGATGSATNPSRSSAEIYDPAARTWSATGSMQASRMFHSATLLRDGKVLVAGGAANTSASGALSSAELYDPATGAWTPAGSMAVSRYLHVAALLPDGKVIVAAGAGISGVLASAELYDPANGTWSPTGSMGTARHLASSAILPDGSVLVAGGSPLVGGSGALSSAEIYNPAAGLWVPAGSMGTARQGAPMTVLPDGRVLATGGWGGALPLASTELYDVATGSWAATGSMAAGRYRPTASLLANGKVLVAGGMGGFTGPALSSAEWFDPAAGSWSATGPMSTERATHTATLLPDNTVLAAGGTTGAGVTALAELFYATPPKVVSTSPDNAATGVSIGAALVVNFREAMDPTTIVPTAFRLSRGGLIVGCTATPDGRRATFRPLSPLEYNTLYTATVATSVKDLAGIPMDVEYTWSFVTQTGPTPVSGPSITPFEHNQGIEFVGETLGCDVAGPGRGVDGAGAAVNLLVLAIPAILLLARRRT